jgi:toxin FitB
LNIVDSSGWLEYFANGPNAGSFAELLVDREKLLVPAIIVDDDFKGLGGVRYFAKKE